MAGKILNALVIVYSGYIFNVSGPLELVRDLILNNLAGDCGREVALVHAGPVATGCLAERQ